MRSRASADNLPRRPVEFVDPSRARTAASILARSDFSCPKICVIFMRARIQNAPINAVNWIFRSPAKPQM